MHSGFSGTFGISHLRLRCSISSIAFFQLNRTRFRYNTGLWRRPDIELRIRIFDESRCSLIEARGEPRIPTPRPSCSRCSSCNRCRPNSVSSSSKAGPVLGRWDWQLEISVGYKPGCPSRCRNSLHPWATYSSTSSRPPFSSRPKRRPRACSSRSNLKSCRWRRSAAHSTCRLLQEQQEWST